MELVAKPMWSRWGAYVVVGLAEIKANSAQLELELWLSLAKISLE